MFYQLGLERKFAQQLIPVDLHGRLTKGRPGCLGTYAFVLSGLNWVLEVRNA